MSERIHPVWHVYRPFTPADTGIIHLFLLNSDPRCAHEQFDERYAHGGGWRPFNGFTMTETGIEYPGDRPMRLIGECRLRKETIRLYECGWVAIVQPDGSYEISRMD